MSARTKDYVSSGCICGKIKAVRTVRILNLFRTRVKNTYSQSFQRFFVDGIQLITKLKSNMKEALTSVSDRLLLRKRAIIETVNDELKNIAQVELSRHRCFDKFIVNLLGAIAAYCLFPKKPCINVQRTIDTQLTLF